MSSYSKITLIGHTGNDPRIFDHEGQKGANFSLAVNAYTKPNEPQKTNWFHVTFWGKNAETIEKYIKKGNRVYVEGRLSPRMYIDDTGQNRFSLDVQGQTFLMIGSKEESKVNNDVNKQEPQAEAETESEPDDLPF